MGRGPRGSGRVSSSVSPRSPDHRPARVAEPTRSFPRRRDPRSPPPTRRPAPTGPTPRFRRYRPYVDERVSTRGPPFPLVGVHRETRDDLGPASAPRRETLDLPAPARSTL